MICTKLIEVGGGKKSYTRTNPYIDLIFDSIFYPIIVWNEVSGFKISVRAHSTNSRCNYSLRTLVNYLIIVGLAHYPFFKRPCIELILSCSANELGFNFAPILRIHDFNFFVLFRKPCYSRI